jgi:hypothetical protein
MPFRDDAEALRSRLEALEVDLRRAEAEVERSRTATIEAQRLREALAKIEAQLAEVRGESLNPRVQRTTAAVLAGGMALVVAGAMVARSTITHVPVMISPHAASYARPVMLPSQPPQEARWFAPRLFSATVGDALGEAPVASGTRCDVLVAATEIESLACRVTITCQGALLYGGDNQGYLPCRVFDGQPTTGEDVVGIEDDGDPMLDMDLPSRRIVVTNDRPAIWRVELAIAD